MPPPGHELLDAFAPVPYGTALDIAFLSVNDRSRMMEVNDRMMIRHAYCLEMYRVCMLILFAAVSCRIVYACTPFFEFACWISIPAGRLGTTRPPRVIQL